MGFKIHTNHLNQTLKPPETDIMHVARVHAHPKEELLFANLFCKRAIMGSLTLDLVGTLGFLGERISVRHRMASFDDQCWSGR